MRIMQYIINVRTKTIMQHTDTPNKLSVFNYLIKQYRPPIPYRFESIIYTEPKTAYLICIKDLAMLEMTLFLVH